MSKGLADERRRRRSTLSDCAGLRCARWRASSLTSAGAARAPVAVGDASEKTGGARTARSRSACLQLSHTPHTSAASSA
jgi:hypothetical protein